MATNVKNLIGTTVQWEIHLFNAEKTLYISNNCKYVKAQFMEKINGLINVKK